MPVILQDCNDLVLSVEEVAELWQLVRQRQKLSDDEVTVRCVDEAESQRLNREYRGQDAPTNVLTFSYDTGDHDIALCCAVAEREAQARGAAVRDYSALLVVHAFLHAAGMDHERSAQAAAATAEAERDILEAAGLTGLELA